MLTKSSPVTARPYYTPAAIAALRSMLQAGVMVGVYALSAETAGVDGPHGPEVAVILRKTGRMTFAPKHDPALKQSGIVSGQVFEFRGTVPVGQVADPAEAIAYLDAHEAELVGVWN